MKKCRKKLCRIVGGKKFPSASSSACRFGFYVDSHRTQAQRGQGEHFYIFSTFCYAVFYNTFSRFLFRKWAMKERKKKCFPLAPAHSRVVIRDEHESGVKCTFYESLATFSHNIASLKTKKDFFHP